MDLYHDSYAYATSQLSKVLSKAISQCRGRWILAMWLADHIDNDRVRLVV